MNFKEEIKKRDLKAWFIVFTFNTESYRELNEQIPEKYTGYDRENAIVTRAVRLFTERWRKHKGKTIRHWFVTELGQEGETEHIHIHGIVWTNEPFEEVREIWKYGFVYPRTTDVKRNRVNAASISYIMKYVTK